jgi:hypothetical protein
MKISKRKRLLVIISLMLFPMVIMLCSFSLNVQAGPSIPEPDPGIHDWHWEVDEGDQLYFEGEFIVKNASTGDLISMWKDIWIYNITTIENVTINWLGLHEFSQVNATQCYFNASAGELEAYDSDGELALFGYNSTDPITHRVRAGMSGMPFLLPINGTNGFEADVLAPVINETFYTPMGQMAYNNFTHFDWDVGSNRIHFWHDSLDYYSDGYYYNNGTLAYGEAYLLVDMGGDPIYVNATMKQVPDYIITDEVEWGVNVGDEIPITMYMGSSDVDDAQEMLINITSIDTDVLFNKSKNSFSDEDNTYMVFRCVYADIFEWNGTDYIFGMNTIVGAANNFYPQYYDEVGGDPIMPFIWPINVPLEDYEFMWNYDTLDIWEEMRYDTINIVENGLLEFELSNSTSIDYVKIQIDKTTGVTQSFLNINYEGEVMYFEERSQTLVDWDVSAGETIYYKSNEGDEFWDTKVTILGMGSVYVNMSYLFSPMGIPLPSGQPEYQFFSYLYAERYGWDVYADSWMYDGDQPFAIANNYWPVSPLQFEFGPPLLMPMGTTSSELSNLFDFYGTIFDDITYSTGHVLMRNSTLDREWNFHFDETTGRLEMMYGWIKQPAPGEEWHHMSIYPKFYEELSAGTTHHIVAQTDFLTGMIVGMDITVDPGIPGSALVSNYFPMNPINISIPEGTPLAFFDQLLINWSYITTNITITITFPSSIDIDEIIFYFYAYNMSGTLEWDEAPPEYYDNYVTFNSLTNSITYLMEPEWYSAQRLMQNGSLGFISAIAYKTIEEALEEIPGYNLFFLSMMIIIVSGLVIRKIRKK